MQWYQGPYMLLLLKIRRVRNAVGLMNLKCWPLLWLLQLPLLLAKWPKKVPFGNLAMNL